MSTTSPDTPPESSAFAEQWARFCGRLSSCNERLANELAACRREAQSILEAQDAAVAALALPATDQPVLEYFESCRAAARQAVLRGPVSSWERKRPVRRALMAIESYDATVGDLVRSIPESLEVTGPELIAALDALVPAGISRRLCGYRRKKRSLPLRRIVGAELQRLLRHRSLLEGRYMLALTLTLRHLRRPWELIRTAVDTAVHGRRMTEQELETARTETLQSGRSLVRDGESAEAACRAFQEQMEKRLAQRILFCALWRSRTPAEASRETRNRNLGHWSSQLRAAEAEVRLEAQMGDVEEGIIRLTKGKLESLTGELASLLSELDGVIESLRRRMEHNLEEEFPPPKADVIPAASRLAEFQANLRAQLQSVPQACEIYSKFTALPTRRAQTRVLHPRETFHKAFARTGLEPVSNVLEEVEGEHRKVVQEIERAREVVAFGLETSVSEEGTDPEILRESLQNAHSLLEFYRGERPDWRDSADIRLTRAVASVFLECRFVLGRHRLGAVTYLAQQGFRRAIVLAAGTAGSSLRRGLVAAWRLTEVAFVSFLVYIGWKQAPTGGRLEVVTRPFLPAEFIVDLSRKELPSLYRRLFRLEPVQDPRFLIGREREMAAIMEARSFWEAGRPAALIMVGQRGSGKTSLINCALKRSLEDLEFFRGEFGERLVDAEAMRSFLARFLQIPDPAELEKRLAERRRVIIIEELERTFLRQVGYYSSIRELQKIVASTCNTTFWMLAVNQVAFRYLNASVQLGQSFSHRINAGTASREDLRRACMLRHNLSGLRIQFAAPPERSVWLQRVRRSGWGQQDAEEAFFAELERESAGIYRTAFDIWLGQIDLVQAGALYMKPLVPPDLTPVVEDLDMDDLFTLVAVLQHGSLTEKEHATVFLKSPAASRAQMDELLSREIIEPDPGRNGFRVRPEAMRVVKEALYRRNLL